MLLLTTLLSFLAANALASTATHSDLVVRDSRDPIPWINNIPQECGGTCTPFANSIRACSGVSGGYDTSRSNDNAKCMCTNDNAATLRVCANCISNLASFSGDPRNNIQSGLNGFSNECRQKGYSIPSFDFGSGVRPGPGSNDSPAFFSVGRVNGALSFQDNYGILGVTLAALGAICGLFTLL